MARNGMKAIADQPCELNGSAAKMPLIQRKFMSPALNPPLDGHDTRILAELQADARLSMAENWAAACI